MIVNWHNIWSSCQYKYNSISYLDMTSDTWCNLSVSEQQKYASLYRENYSKKNNLQLEMTLHHSGVKFILSLIPPGRFWMGSPEGCGYFIEHPYHKVLLTKPYYLCKYEVTQRQWKAVISKNLSYFRESGYNAPVDSVSWNECVEFCKRISVIKLPTEAQWEYACKAGVTCAYYFGNLDSDLDMYGWYDKNSGNKTHSIGEKKPNAWELYDMSGNLWEWCADWYGNYIDGEIIDPIGPNFGSYRVFRGGSWHSYSDRLRSSDRGSNTPTESHNYTGFRFLLEV